MKTFFIQFQLEEKLKDEMYTVVKSMETALSTNFKPMKREHLHMTAAFLHKFPQENNKEYFRIVRNMIKDYRMKYTLKFKKYSLFGEGKNILVAEYETPIELKREILNLKMKLYEMGLCEYEEYFTAHITLGKIMDTTHARMQTIDKVLIPNIDCIKLEKILF
jgi:2'-5' RNA ligase